MNKGMSRRRNVWMHIDRLSGERPETSGSATSTVMPTRRSAWQSESRRTNPGSILPPAFDWFEGIDGALALLNVPLSVQNLLYRGFLFPIPHQDGYPAAGWWTEEEVAAAAEVYQSLDVLELDSKTRRKIGRYLKAIDDVRSWIEFAANCPGNWLIGLHC